MIKVCPCGPERILLEPEPDMPDRCLKCGKPTRVIAPPQPQARRPGNRQKVSKRSAVVALAELRRTIDAADVAAAGLAPNTSAAGSVLHQLVQAERLEVETPGRRGSQRTTFRPIREERAAA